MQGEQWRMIERKLGGELVRMKRIGGFLGIAVSACAGWSFADEKIPEAMPRLLQGG